MSDKHSDSHTLYVKCDCASANQIRQAFGEALNTYQTKSGKRLDCRYRVNLLTNREGKSFGVAFVFVTDASVYYMLLGMNPDGSDRIEYIDDPSWEPPVEGEITNDAGWSSIPEPVVTPGMSWADIYDEEEEYERKMEEEAARHTCPKIIIQLEPLMVLPPYKLTPEQIEIKRRKIIDENDGKEGFDPSLVAIEQHAHFCVERAIVVPVDPKYMPNILKARKIPQWVTKQQLKTEFTPYASDSTTLQERIIKGNRIMEAYPFVNINDDGVAFIIFDPSTRDAQFALHMMMKTNIKLAVKKSPDTLSLIKKLDESTTVTEDADKYFLSTTLIFGHSYCTDRDSMSNITQQPRPAHRRDFDRRSKDNSHKNRRNK